MASNIFRRLKGVLSVFGRTGPFITAASGDYTAAQVTNAADKSSVSTQTFNGDLNIPSSGKYRIGNSIMLVSTIPSGGSNLFIGGANPNAASANTGIGYNAVPSLTGSAQFDTAVGYYSLNGCTDGAFNTGVGTATLAALTTGNGNVAIGSTAGYGRSGNLNPTACIFIGRQSGYESSTSIANTFIAGHNQYPVTDVYFGDGDIEPASTAGRAWTLHGTQANGTNLAGGALQLAGGVATGNAAGGDVIFQASIKGSSGSTAQTLSEVGRFTLAGTSGSNADVILSLGNSTVSDGKIKLKNLTNSNTTIIKPAAPSASRIYTVPDAGADASFVMTEGAQTINGAKTYGGAANFNGGINAKVASTQTANYTAVASDCVIPGDATSGGITITLPASPGTGQLIWITKMDNSINTVQIAPNTGQTIVGIAGNVSLPTQGASNIVIYAGGNNWLSR